MAQVTTSLQLWQDESQILQWYFVRSLFSLFPDFCSIVVVGVWCFEELAENFAVFQGLVDIDLKFKCYVSLHFTGSQHFLETEFLYQMSLRNESSNWQPDQSCRHLIPFQCASSHFDLCFSSSPLFCCTQQMPSKSFFLPSLFFSAFLSVSSSNPCAGRTPVSLPQKLYIIYWLLDLFNHDLQ